VTGDGKVGWSAAEDGTGAVPASGEGA
jgi:hypothetical protein